MKEKGSKKTSRTEEEKILQTGANVTLGGTEYCIPPLSIKYSVPWCQKVVNLFKDVPQYSKITTDDPEGFGEGLEKLMAGKPGEFIKLFFEYAKDLKREEIEEVATSKELFAAFEEVVKLESPFFGATTRVMEAVSR